MTNVVLSCGADINSQKNDDGNSALLIALKVILKGQDFKKCLAQKVPAQDTPY